MKTPEAMCTRQDLETAFQAIGITTGMILIVHTSMKSLGWIPGGARSVVDALLAAIGPEGTLVMPTHTGDNSDPRYWSRPPVPAEWWDAIRRETPVFDPARSPSRGMGAVVECFRAYPGVQRSNHPTYSFIACGPAAEQILARHDLEGGLGEHSPCGALEREDAHVLLLGVDFDNCTVMHLAEFRGEARTFYKQASAVLRDGQRVWTEYKELNVNSDDFFAPGRELAAAGLVRQSRLHQADLRLFRARDAVAAAQSWLLTHRMRRLGDSERSRVMAYLKTEPEYNLFIIGDIENHGVSTDFQDVLIYEKNDQIDSVLLRYHQSYLVYSQSEVFEIEPILTELQTPNLKVLSGKKSILDKLLPHLKNLEFRNTYLMKLGRGELTADDNRPAPRDCRLKAAVVSDVPAIIDFVDTIQEFTSTMTREARLTQMTTDIQDEKGHYFCFENQGRIIAVAGTSAENSLSAMVVSVATDPAWRGRGLASQLVSELARTLLAERMQYLCLFYDNPDAGRIYRRLGFKDAGQWVMALRPKTEVEAK